MAVQHIDGPEQFASAFPVSRETVDRLETYAGLLRQWQKAVNLVAPGTLEAVWGRHFADSAQLWRRGQAAWTWTDLGSGAGFPGLVIAILAAELSPPPGCRVTLIESDMRKAAFLREVARRTGVSVDILSIRIETAATQIKVPATDCVSARALAPLDRLLGLALPFFGPDTTGLFLKGREVDAEIENARKSWAFEIELIPSMTQEDARIAVVRRLRRKTED